jgi:spore maturation protein CgeB
MRILLVGDGHAQIHEPALAMSLKNAGAQIETFFWNSYFSSKNRINRFLYKIENKLLYGPRIQKIQTDLIDAVIRYQPEVVFIYRGTHIFASTLRTIRQLGYKVVLFNNDDPFSKNQSRLLWRHFKRGIKFSNLALAYRKHNITDYLLAGAPESALFRSWYIPDKNRKVQLSPEDYKRWESDIIFIGHFEDDGRLDLIEALASGPWKFKLFGPEWDRTASKSKVLKNRVPILQLHGEDYNNAISSAKIAICLFSKLNRDTYTRRCFEIPASGTMMLSEYSDDMAGMFEADREVVFFRSGEELIQKAKYYLTHHNEREAIARRGYERVTKDGHDVNSRAKQLIQLINKFCV